MSLSNIQLLILRIALAALFLSEGFGKIDEGWLTNDQHLLQSLNNFHQHATGAQLVYLEKIAMPYASLWSKLMAMGETCVGVSLLLGLLTRLSSIIGIFMVLNFHASTGNLYSLSFFGTAWAGLIVASFLVIFLARGGRWFGIDAMLAKETPGGKFW